MAHPEQLLLSALLNSGDVLQVEELGLSPAHFHSFREELEWLINYKIKYRAEPSYSAFKSQFPDFVLLEHQDVQYGIEEVRESHLKHQLTKMARKLTTELSHHESPSQILADMQSETMKLGVGIETSVSMVNSITDPSASLDYALLREMDDFIPGIPFAHSSLQERTYGMNNGEVTVFAARLNQGKSWVLVNESAHAVLAGKKVMYFSLEMNKRSMEYRFQTLFANRFRKPFTHTMLDKGRHLDLLEYKQYLSFLADNIPGELFIYDNSRGTVTPQTIAALVNKHNPDLVVIDYLTLLGASGGQKAMEGWQVVASITGDLKHLATAFDTAILTASQINRDGDTSSWRPPQPKNLSQGDTIGQDSDNVITMKRFGKGAMVYSLEKCRSSQAGLLWWSTFDPEHGSFAEITRDEAEQIRAQEEYGDDGY